MSHRTGDGIIVICATDSSVCELCGAIAELRPYGPNGENICFECGQKNKEMTENQMMNKLFGLKDN